MCKTAMFKIQGEEDESTVLNSSKLLVGDKPLIERGYDNIYRQTTWRQFTIKIR